MDKSKSTIPKGRNRSNIGEISKPISICKFAFDISRILNTVLIFLTKIQLLQCRFVTRSWNEATTLRLQKLNKFFFLDYTLQKKGKTIEELIALFRNHEQLKMSSFFCTNFKFINRKDTCCDDTNNHENLKLIDNIHLRQLLSTYGAYFKKLTLDNLLTCASHVPTEEIIIKEMVELLTVQAPNLEEINLVVGSLYSKPNERNATPFLPNRTVYSLTRDELEQCHSKYSNLNAHKNYNLKSIDFQGRISAKVMELMYFLAPNLKEINVENCKLDCLLEPQNRLYFLKFLEYPPLNVYFLKVLKKIAQKNIHHIIKLREIQMYLEPTTDYCQCDFTPEKRARVIDITNTILESSWDSLECIWWWGVETTKGLKWPELMPKLRIFRFDKHRTITENNIIPTNFSWSKRFPRLQQFTINDRVEDTSPQDLIKLFNLEPVKTVNEVYGGWNLTKYSIVLEVFQMLKMHFPKAVICLTKPCNL